MSPFAAQLFAIAQPITPQDMEEMEAEYRFGYLHNFTGRPVYLPTASPKDIEDELSRLKKPEFRGTPKEL